MKKHIVLALVLLALLAMALPAMAEAPAVKFGMLSMLNLGEEEAAELAGARGMALSQLDIVKSGTPSPVSVQVVYYDTLDAMLMALNVGDIDVMDVYESTALYLTRLNPDLVMGIEYKDEEELDALESDIYRGLLSSDFAFMLMEDNAALRDEFNRALEAISDEEYAQLIADHITAPLETGELTPVEMPVFDGAETIKVAVTGSLPPMDYVGPDGAPVGFNTALLAEVSKRLEKNIELVQVDSLGRAAALASGTVDVVFWTRTNSQSNRRSTMTEEEKNREYETNILPHLTEEERAFVDDLRMQFDEDKYGKIDMPVGTIITESYYSDVSAPVMTKTSAEAWGTR